jgi:hypothetical protein
MTPILALLGAAARLDRMFDRLEIVIAEIDLPVGAVERAEIVVNGTPLTERVEQVEKDTRYAPLVPDHLLPRLRDALASGLRPTQVHALGCSCGVDRCSWVMLIVRSRPEAVRWDGFETSRSGAVPVGPFVFDRNAYERAIAAPRVSARPLRPYAS